MSPPILRFRALDAWPRPSTPPDQRRGRPFRMDFFEIRYSLFHELVQLDATEAEIGVQVLPGQIRRDGSMPLATAKALHPGVILWAHTPNLGELEWACDSCATWQHNVRAIAITLERLRLADLYNVMQGRQYRGFQALPKATEPSVLEELATILGWPRSDVIADPRGAVKAALKKTHPDTNRGVITDAYHKVQAARAVLGV